MLTLTSGTDNSAQPKPWCLFCSAVLRCPGLVGKVSATTLDDIWFPLIKKKGLNKKPVAAEASGLSDLSATYRLIPRSSQLSQAKEVNMCNRTLLCPCTPCSD